MTDKSTQMVGTLKAEMEKALKPFVGRELETSDAIKNEVSLATQRCLHNLNAQMHGGEVISCATMWERFTWKMKCKWFIVNKLIPSIGITARDQFRDAKTAWHEINNEHDEYFPLNINPLFELNPKGVIQTDVSIKLNEPVEFIGIKATIENGELKLEGGE